MRDETREYYNTIFDNNIKITATEEEKRLATYIHEKCCRENHTDGCSWFYETDPETQWNQYAHKKYLLKVKKLMELTNNITLIQRITDILQL